MDASTLSRLESGARRLTLDHLPTLAHHPSDMQITGLRPHLPELFYSASEVAGSLDPDQWHVLVADARPRMTTDSEGRTIRIHDAVLRARRRAGPG